ncbi:hypothetical protein [Nostoc favosum]|uniref:Uncharacterized protein n=1 Tax=Nostoc favosum CHAB5714 TaxID=2780399 RepID=A0ABS8ILC6_9NOSO|nr:hypothetical protein [Nostoc favosum]MCC5604826.1 hypothetical protein [Nostoc favosum CHAB5714]
MNGSTNMRTTQQVMDITGAPAQVWGNVLVPAKGTITVKVRVCKTNTKALSCDFTL